MDPKKITILTFLLLVQSACSLEEEILDQASGQDLLEGENVELNLVAPAYAALSQVYGCCGTAWIVRLSKNLH